MDESRCFLLPRLHPPESTGQRRRSPSSRRRLRPSNSPNLQNTRIRKLWLMLPPLNRGLRVQRWCPFPLNLPVTRDTKLTVLRTLSMATHDFDVQILKRMPRSCIWILRSTIKVLESINTSRISKCKNQEILNMYVCICIDLACFDPWQECILTQT